MIQIKSLKKAYGDKIVYNGFNLSIEKNKVTAILGESGSGKTTLLKILARLTDYDGQISGLDKNISFVFQKDLLVPNLTVKQNLELVCKNIDLLKELESVGMSGTENLYPKSLSAGMSRRVSILRALNFNSNVLFMDEPFINLDLGIKCRLIEKIKNIQGKDPRTVVLVTHSIMEATKLANRIVVLRKGEIIRDIKEITKKTENELFSLMSRIN